jgi:LAO/AO transport system kinase
VVRVRALEPGGAEDLWEAVERHRAHLGEDDRLRERRREGLTRQLRALAVDRLSRRVEQASSGALDELVGRVLERRIDPSGAVDELLADQ